MSDGISEVDLYKMPAKGGPPLLTSRIDAYFAHGYNLINTGHVAGVQGGFLDMRLDLVVFKYYCCNVLEGYHQP